MKKKQDGSILAKSENFFYDLKIKMKIYQALLFNILKPLRKN